jgi:3-hydroxybutyryl-CoA dehydrogenase
MGLGIAQVCASAGFRTIVFDSNANHLKEGLTNLERDLDSAVQRGKLTAFDRDQIGGNIRAAGSLEDTKADLVIEAIIEKLDVKRELFAALEKVNDQNAILATNTSSLPVTDIATALKNRGRFVGLHFFNPATIMKLVEIVAGKDTSEDCVQLMTDFVKRIRKTGAVVKDSPGFIVNRVARHYYLESLQLLGENAVDVKGIDALMRSAGFKMGPFELMDLIGIDTNFYVTSSLYEAFGKPEKFKPSPLQEQKVASKHLGRKTGKGFYDYEKK